MKVFTSCLLPEPVLLLSEGAAKWYLGNWRANSSRPKSLICNGKRVWTLTKIHRKVVVLGQCTNSGAARRPKTNPSPEGISIIAPTRLGGQGLEPLDVSPAQHYVVSLQRCAQLLHHLADMAGPLFLPIRLRPRRPR